MSDDEVLDRLEIDLDIAQCGEILEAFGVHPDPCLVLALWTWKAFGAGAAHAD